MKITVETNKCLWYDEMVSYFPIVFKIKIKYTIEKIDFGKSK